VRTPAWPVVLCVAFLAACTHTLQRTIVNPASPSSAPLPRQGSSYLKVHMRDGRAYVLSPWRVDEAPRQVVGAGRLLDARRQVLAERDSFAIPLDSVALLETNEVRASGASAALTGVTLGSLAMTAYCISNPKACFGSCPTFYVTDGTAPRLMAEGFSASVAPALEGRDIDALYRAAPRTPWLDVRMTNEALETHVVRHVRILAARRPAGGRVFATDSGQFWGAHVLGEALRCRAAEGDCLAALAVFDGRERFSRADSADLATRETIELEFDRPPEGRLGLVIASRQTLLSTYLFYQALAFMGTRAGEWLAALDRSSAGTRQQVGEPGRLLGGIDVQIADSAGGWSTVGRTAETGPLAPDVRLVILPDAPSPGPLRARLRLTKGAWRLDWVALASLGARVTPDWLDPISVRRGDSSDAAALSALLDSSRTLVTFPGDAFTIGFHLPDDFGAYELFLDSRGYYLEWMRQEWLAEEDAARATLMFTDPARTLRDLAPGYARLEPQMERVFWGSRYARP